MMIDPSTLTTQYPLFEGPGRPAPASSPPDQGGEPSPLPPTPQQPQGNPWAFPRLEEQLNLWAGGAPQDAPQATSGAKV